MARLSVTTKLPYERRVYAALAETVDDSSRWTLALISQLYGRTPHPWLMALSTVVVVAPVPNSGFDRGPSSLSCGMKSPLSRQVRVADALNSSGLFVAANPVPSRTTYRLALALSAVLLSPNRS